MGSSGGGSIGPSSFVRVRVNSVVTANNSMGATKWSGGTPSVLAGESDWWDAVEYEITPPVPGWYYVKVFALWQSGANINERRAVGYASDASEIGTGPTRNHDTAALFTFANEGMVYLDGTQAIWATWGATSADTIDMRMQVIGPLVG